MHDKNLTDWRNQALALDAEINKAVVGQDHAIKLLVIAVFARGHALLEGDVGVGKTTLLRALAQVLGGDYERIEGTIDLMPNDLIYHTYINEQGRPAIDPGPLLKHGDRLATFFFNEVNRARPQVHSLLLRVMAEKSVTAFNQEYVFPHLQVFADRNRVEREETFELPAAARDRFLMELNIALPEDLQVQRDLMFDPRFFDVDALIGGLKKGVVPYDRLNEISALIQRHVGSSDAIEKYALDLCAATRQPHQYGITLDDIDMERFVLSGVSPRGMGMLVRAAKVAAWLNERDAILPEDIHMVLYETLAHRVFFHPVYELQRSEIVGEFMNAIVAKVAAP
ncbi:MAG: AAA family ATPase [Gammaproteobacteria bacterium]